MKSPEGAKHPNSCVILLFAIVAGILLVFSLPENSLARTINVPADYPTIQAAINAAANGDTIQVAPGTYHENINFSGKAITVTSTAGPQTTIIDGGLNGSVVVFDSREGASSILSGFTIQNGSPTEGEFAGGGVLISDASPKIANNIIENNQACEGAGMAILFGSPLVQGNTITQNREVGCSGGTGGGGILIQGSASTQIIGNTITNNTIGSDGGGISLWAAGTPTIENNLISGNYATDDGGAVSMVNGSAATIVQNVIVGNSAQEGGGIYWLGGSGGPILVNNTIAANLSPNGSALFSDGSSSQTVIVNNIVTASSTQSAVACSTTYGSAPQVNFSDVFSPAGAAYDSSCGQDQTGSNGNISADPLFFDPVNNNFHVPLGSPVIDTGSNSAPGLLPTDFDGNPRIYNGTVDMGAYEFFPATMSISATSFTFGPTAFGTSSPAQTLTVTNTGSTKLLLDISVPSGFSETSTCGSVVAPGANCTISITFVPTARGASTGMLLLTSNASGGPASVSLTGTGIAPLLNLSSTSLSFGNQLEATTSIGQTVTISNVGDIPLAFNSITASGDFSLSNSTCSGLVAVDSSCAVDITFTPVTVGQSVGALTLTDNAPGTPQTVGLTGTGFIYAVPQVDLPLSPASAAPGGAAFTLTVNGSGYAPASVVYWRGSPRPTTFISATELTAAIPASDISSPVTALITVVNPSPGGGTSNAVAFQVIASTSGLAFSRTDLAVGLEPEFIAEADFNGDGKPDLAVSNGGSNTVSILLGKGDGTFQPRVDYATGLEPGAIAVGDFNKDGKPDLAVANISCPITGGTCSFATISILLGNGDGTFQPQKTLAVNYVPRSIAVGDFNGDGMLDLAVSQNGTSGGVVTIFLGNGDGTFKPGVDYRSGPQSAGVPSSLAMGDFNRDGRLDVAAASDYPISAISILVGNGDGTFQSPVQYPTGIYPRSVVAADFNGDGILDLAVTDSAPGVNAVSVLLGNGNGTFRSYVSYTAGVTPSGLSAADVFGDGKLDLVTANSSSNTVSVLKGNGDGTFQANVDFPVGITPQSVVAADFNGDGRLDLATANFGSNTVSILLQVPATTESLSDNSLTFGNQNAGTTSAAQILTITNTGNEQLYVGTIATTGDFVQTNTCGNPVAPNASCSITVSFTPLYVGSRTGSLTFTSNASASPQTVTLNGAGTGVGFEQMPGVLSHISVGSDGTVWGINSAGQVWIFSTQGQTWVQAPGLLTQIAVGANGFIWGLNAAGQIWRFDPSIQSWDSIAGNLSSIAVGSDGDVWGLNSAQQVWHFNTQKQNWDAIPGSLTQIAVGYDGAVWGLSAQGQIWRFNPGTQSFQQVPGSLTQLAVGADGDVWGIDSANQVWHFNTLTQNWENVPGSLTQITVGSGGNVWGLNTAGQVWRYDAAIQSWDQVPGVLAQIAAGANGAVWGIDAKQAVFQLSQPAQPTSTFHQLPGQLAQIAVGIDGNVWGINSAQQIWHFNPLTQNWDNVPGSLTQVAVGFGGNVWGLNAEGQVWRFNIQAQTWEQVPGLLSQIAVGANGDVWGLNSAGQIWRFDSPVQNWQQIPGLLNQIEVGADGTVWGLNSGKQIWRFNPETQNWDSVPGSLAQIAVGSADGIWGINDAGQVWRWDATIQSWDPMPGSLAHIAVGFDGAVWGTNSANQVWRFNVQTQNWDSIPGSLNQITVPSDAVIWGINGGDQVYLFR